MLFILRNYVWRPLIKTYQSVVILCLITNPIIRVQLYEIVS